MDRRDRAFPGFTDARSARQGPLRSGGSLYQLNPVTDQPVPYELTKRGAVAREAACCEPEAGS